MPRWFLLMARIAFAIRAAQREILISCLGRATHSCRRHQAGASAPASFPISGIPPRRTSLGGCPAREVASQERRATRFIRGARGASEAGARGGRSPRGRNRTAGGAFWLSVLGDPSAVFCRAGRPPRGWPCQRSAGRRDSFAAPGASEGRSPRGRNRRPGGRFGFRARDPSRRFLRAGCPAREAGHASGAPGRRDSFAAPGVPPRAGARGGRKKNGRRGLEGRSRRRVETAPLKRVGALA